MSSDSELSAFFESSNDNKDIDVVYSQYTPYRIAISQSCPQHYVIRTFWPRDSKTIFESKIAQFSGVIESPIFFQTRFKLWNSVFKILNFPNIEKLISLHIHFKQPDQVPFLSLYFDLISKTYSSDFLHDFSVGNTS